MGRDRFCRLRRMITGLATITVKRRNARVVWNTKMTLVVDPSMNPSFGGRSLVDAEQIASLKSARDAVHHPRWTARGAIVLLVQPCDDGMDVYAEFL